MSSYAPTDTDAPCRPATAAVRAGIDRDTAYGAVTPPIVLSSNFSFAGFAQKREYDYTRSGNPTRDLLAEALAELEGGAGAVVTATVEEGSRPTTRANHSAAHLFHAAVKNVLGAHVAQKGQMVDAERMRFDFSHNAPLTDEEQGQLAALLKRWLLENE